MTKILKRVIQILSVHNNERELAYAWGVPIKEMTYTDYKSIVMQEFENENVDEYLFTQAILPEVDPLDLEEVEKNENKE